MATMNLVSVYAEDIEALSSFYIEVFGYKEFVEMRFPAARIIWTGRMAVCFHSHAAYEMLDLQAHEDTLGIKFMLNLDCDTQGEVERLVQRAVDRGAELVKGPYETFYGWYQAVVLDPEGNCIRINHVLPQSQTRIPSHA